MTALEQAVTLSEQAGDRRQMAIALTSLGRVHRIHGQLDKALACYRRALELQRAISDPANGVNTLNAIGAAQLVEGHISEALETFRLALSAAKQGNRTQLARKQEILLGFAYLVANDREKGVPLIENNFSAAGTPLRCEMYRRLAELRLEEGKLEDALLKAEGAVKLAEYGNVAPVQLLAIDVRARILAKLGRVGPALNDARQLLRILEECVLSWRRWTICAAALRNSSKGHTNWRWI